MGSPFGQKNATSSGTSNSTATTTFSPEVQKAYDNLLGQLSGETSTNAATTGATSGLTSLASSSNPNFGTASSTLSNAATPAYQSISNYVSPYLNQALTAQEAVQNNQNAQQQQQLLGNAAVQGALGGNRVAVAQAQLAGQQALANNQANSALINSAYQNAENAALQGQANQTAAGSAQADLGSAQNASSLSNLLGLLQAGQTPYANLGTLANAAQTLSGSGATVTSQGSSTQTQPVGNGLSSIIGLGTALAGLFAKGGTVPAYADGGDIAGLMQAAATAGNQATQLAQQPAGGQNDAMPQLTDEQQKGVQNLHNWLFKPAPAVPDASAQNLYSLGGMVPRNDNRRSDNDNRPHYDLGGFVDFPYADFNDVNSGIVDAPASITPSLVGSSSVPAVVGNTAVAHSSIPDAADIEQMFRDANPAPGALANPSLVRLAPGETPNSRMEARDQQMKAQGFPVLTLGALAAADEEAYGLPSGYLARTAQIESGGNPGATNPSGATGLFQFMPSTAAQYGLGNPANPVASTNAAAHLAADNAKVLSAGLGREPTAAELYLAHQQGAGGALGLLRNPDAPAASIIGKDAVLQNGGNLDMTAGQFAGMWENKFDNGRPSAFPAGQAAPGSPYIQAPDVNGVVPSTGLGIRDSNAGYATNLGDALKSLEAGKGLNLSPDARMGLVAAGLGMMGGTSANAFANIGQGGLAGLQTWMAKQQLNRENALAQSAIAAQQGELGLQGQEVQQAGQQLYLNALKNQADIAQELAGAGATNVEAARNRFVQTPMGMIEYDPTNPSAPPKVIPYAQMIEGSAGSGAQQEQAPRPDENGFITTAPAAQAPSPLLMNPTTAPVIIQQSQTALGGAQGDAINAQALNAQLSELSDLAKDLPQTGVLSQGAGFNQRLEMVKGLNAALQTMGMAPVDPKDVATAEGMKKLATQLQFSVADAVKNDPAAATIAQAASASPSGESTWQGVARIVGNIEALNKRSIDRYQFLQDWANKHYGDLSGADVAFNEMNPPQRYVKYGQKLAQQMLGQPSASGSASGASPAIPSVGTVMQGYKFLGGDPSQQANWQKVQ